MAKLNRYEKELIIEKASLLQKIANNRRNVPENSEPNSLEELFSVTDEMQLDRELVREAYVEYMGIPVNEPVIVDTGDLSKAEVVGRASGRTDRSVLTELKAQAEYHFNTTGYLSSRKNKVVWKAEPSGLSKVLAIFSSPEVHFEQQGPETLIRVRQNLSTLNKLYVPALITGAISAGMLGAVIFSRAGGDEAPLMVFGGLFALGTWLYSRFVSNRKKRAKHKLSELTETLQGIMERRFRALRTDSQTSSVREEESREFSTDHEPKYTSPVKERNRPTTG